MVGPLIRHDVDSWIRDVRIFFGKRALFFFVDGIDFVFSTTLAQAGANFHLFLSLSSSLPLSLCSSHHFSILACCERRTPFEYLHSAYTCGRKDPV